MGEAGVTRHPQGGDAHDFDAILKAAFRVFTLGPHTVHGPRHWLRVEAFALRLAPATGADVTVARLFARLHDCRRRNEDADPLHGVRAAEFAAGLRGSLIHVDDARFGILEEALRRHNDGDVSGDATIGTCWDADRLDLPRVGIRPHPRLLSTSAARELLTAAGAGEPGAGIDRALGRA